MLLLYFDLRESPRLYCYYTVIMVISIVIVVIITQVELIIYDIMVISTENEAQINRYYDIVKGKF